MNQRRVVVTGMGAITPLGNDVPTFWKNCLAGKSGIRRIQAFDASAYDCKIAGEVLDFDPVPHFKVAKDVRRTDRYVQLAMAASKEAYHQAGLEGVSLDANRSGVIVGSGIGGLTALEKQHKALLEKGPNRVSPFMIPMMITNMASGIISIEFGFKGPNFTVVTACATANQCIGEGWRLIRDNEAEIMIVGGSEAACTPLGIGGFAAMKALSVRNEEPEKASRPFDKDRGGFVMGEGAGIVILEEYEHAKRRGAPILAEMIGYGISADGYHMTSPDPNGEGASRAMTIALQQANKTPEEVDYINAHATATSVGDICETKAIKRSFGAAAKKVPISSTKSMTGHLLGAAGSVELITCIQAIREGMIPPTINLDEPDSECDLDYVPFQARKADVRVALNNSFGFGGHNASLLIQKVED